MNIPASPIRIALVVSALAVVSSLSLAQERRPEGSREGGREGREGGREGREGGREGGPRMNPLFAALDTNGDGVIDATELANATASLKKLDKNGDGKLTEDEVRPAFFGRGGPGGPGGPGGRGGPGMGNPEEMVARLMQFDKNGDGKLSKDELPERMAGMMERGDLDKDGFLSREEIEKLARMGGPGGPGGERGRGGPGGGGEERR